MPDIDLGENYDIEEDSNDDLVITHTPSNSTLRFDSVDELFEFASQARFSEPITDTNGRTLYDPSTGQVGDGSTSADHESVSTGKLNTENSSTVAVLSGDQTVSHNTETLVQLDQTKLNQIGFDTANHKFVSSVDQTVSVSAKIRPRNDLSTLRINIKVNGTIEMNMIDLGGVASFVDKASHTEELVLNAGDEVEVFVRGETSDSSSFDIQGGLTRTTLRIRRV